MNTKKQKNNGFTLLEVLIATFVLMVGVVSSFDLIRSAFFNVSVNEDKLTASYLAAEGLEIVRNIRDNNWKNGSAWDSGISDGSYTVQWLDNSLTNHTNPLSFASNCGFNYNCTNDVASKFSRVIQASHINPDQILIKSIVNWNERGVNSQIDAEEYLFNWNKQ